MKKFFILVSFCTLIFCLPTQAMNLESLSVNSQEELTMQQSETNIIIKLDQRSSNLSEEEGCTIEGTITVTTEDKKSTTVELKIQSDTCAEAVATFKTLVEALTQ